MARNLQQRGQAAATMRWLALTLTSSPGQDTARAGFRPLGVRGPAIFLPNARADRSTVGPGVSSSPGQLRGSRVPFGGSTAGRTSDRRYAVEMSVRLGGRRAMGPSVYDRATFDAETVGTNRITQRGDACDGASSPPDPADARSPLLRAFRTSWAGARRARKKEAPDTRRSPAPPGEPAIRVRWRWSRPPPSHLTWSAGQRMGGRVPLCRSKSV